MSQGIVIPNLGGARAVFVHRPHPTVGALTRQLGAIGLSVEAHWPELPASGVLADYIFFEADMGHDSQFPWKPGTAPMPMIALIGSEAPGRIEWALSHGADSHLVKPVANSGIYSALLIARQGFEARQRLADEVRGLKSRVADRQTIVRAVVALGSGGVGEERAYAQLRALAMSWQTTIEEAARRVLELEQGGRDERATRL